LWVVSGAYIDFLFEPLFVAGFFCLRLASTNKSSYHQATADNLRHNRLIVIITVLYHFSALFVLLERPKFLFEELKLTGPTVRRRFLRLLDGWFSRRGTAFRAEE
jgi:hypothetical protein